MGRVRAGGFTRVITLVLAAALVTGAGGCSGCRKDAGGDGTRDEGSSTNEAPPAASSEGSTEDDDDAGDPRSGDPLVEAGNRFRDAQPRADADGPVDPVCVGGKGGDVSFAVAVVDERCAIGRVRAKKLRAALEHDGGPLAMLRQEGKVLDDGRVAVRLVNTGPAALSLPLIFSAVLPAFLVMAEDEGQTVYELAAPRFEVATAGPGPRTRAHFARIVLEPGGAATATLTIDPAIASVVARRGGGDRADAGASKLTKGHHVLRVGELLTDVEAGAPARVPFDVR